MLLSVHLKEKKNMFKIYWATF